MAVTEVIKLRLSKLRSFVLYLRFIVRTINFTARKLEGRVLSGRKAFWDVFVLWVFFFFGVVVKRCEHFVYLK